MQRAHSRFPFPSLCDVPTGSIPGRESMNLIPVTT
jgi:hypothetical protein